MDTSFKSKKSKIIEELQRRAPNFECPVCKSKNFSIGEGYFAHDLQSDFKNRRIGGVNIPTVPVICSNCGFIAEFAAGAFGILPPPEEFNK
jgi:transcription elongation factor Elf1